MCGTRKYICLGINQVSLIIEEGNIKGHLLHLYTCIQWVNFHQKFPNLAAAGNFKSMSLFLKVQGINTFKICVNTCEDT